MFMGFEPALAGTLAVTTGALVAGAGAAGVAAGFATAGFEEEAFLAAGFLDSAGLPGVSDICANEVSEKSRATSTVTMRLLDERISANYCDSQ